MARQIETKMASRLSPHNHTERRLFSYRRHRWMEHLPNISFLARSGGAKKGSVSTEAIALLPRPRSPGPSSSLVMVELKPTIPEFPSSMCGLRGDEQSFQVRSLDGAETTYVS